jgi:Transglutaminase-like superfamily
MRLPFLKALVGLLTYDLVMLCRNFSTLHRIVKNWRLGGNEPPPDAVGRVCKTIDRACIWYPKYVLCLQRSAVTACMLRSCGVQAQMVIGAQKLPFKAHAWVEVNGRPVNERADVQSVYGIWERC